VPQSADRIISASRRTDLPGCYPDECAQRLLRLRKPVHSVFFWTRYPDSLVRPGLLNDVVRGLESPFVHVTLTGLGGSRFEPRVPPTPQALSQLDPLIELLHGQAERLLWRFDPVLVETSPVERFATLAPELARRGVRTCIFSFPAHLSLKGPLDDQYARHGLSRPDRALRHDTALRLAEVAARAGLRLCACAQAQVVEDAAGAIEAASCIDAALASRLHSRELPLDLPKDPSQRRPCRCAVSHDIGRYTDRCRSGCVYCYSSAGEPQGSAGG
jgi:hypothetical protein